MHNMSSMLFQKLHYGNYSIIEDFNWILNPMATMPCALLSPIGMDEYVSFSSLIKDGGQANMNAIYILPGVFMDVHDFLYNLLVLGL